MIDLKEITVANGIAVLMMSFLLTCRRQNKESQYEEDSIYDVMALVVLAGALVETVSFYVDGKDMACARLLNYMTNSMCFAGTVTVGMLWCMYVDLRVHHDYKMTLHNNRILLIPWIMELAVIVCNLFGTGILFRISEDNVYQRGMGVVIAYITLVTYFAYSMHLVLQAGRRTISLRFFPVHYFVGPCLVGIVVQFFFYGISASWVSASIALIFVQMQTYAENVYKDELSGLFNRRYLSGILKKKKNMAAGSLYGIMMDINDFKKINDTYGHGAGDRAICKVGDVLFRSMPDGGVAIRYAGDEFIALLPGVSEETVIATMKEIRDSLERFNASRMEQFELSLSMGHTMMKKGDDAEAFLRNMDNSMYEDKRKYHGRRQEVL